jgi:hypothetical protein
MEELGEERQWRRLIPRVRSVVAGS